jgi:membrane associated rhomboid family serine protease
VIPVQDVVPTGQTPLATIVLVAVNTVAFAAPQLAAIVLPASLPFVHADGTHFLAALWFLWIFGDQVEARLGRVTFVLLYVISGMAGMYAAAALLPFLPLPLNAAAFAVTGIVGAYFVLLPQARVLTLVPAPVLLAEVPAWFLAALWGLLQLADVATAPRALPGLFAALLLTFALGAVIAVVRRRPIRW